MCESFQGQAAAYQPQQALNSEQNLHDRKRSASQANEDDDNPAAHKRQNTGENQDDACATGCKTEKISTESYRFFTKNEDAGHLSIVHYILHTLPASDQQNLALADRALHKLVLFYRMAHDRRALETKPWISGPPVGSLELYRFNTAIWHALKTIVDSHDKWESTPGTGIDKKLTGLIPVSRTQGLLEQLFLANYPQATKRVNRFLAQAYEHLMKHRKFPPQSELIPLAGDPTHGSERDLYRLYQYIANVRSSLKEVAFYAETDANPDHWSYLKRYTTVKEKRDMLNQPKPDGMDDKAWQKEQRDPYEFLLSYADQVTAQDIRWAAGANSRNQNYTRAVELREKFLAEYEREVVAPDYWLSYIFNIALGDFQRGDALREALFKNLDTPLESCRYQGLFAFHTDMERYTDRIQHLLDDGTLSEGERRIYDSIFYRPEQDILTAIEAYVESSSDTPSKRIKWTRIKMILLSAAVSLHLKAGNLDKAQEFARRLL